MAGHAWLRTLWTYSVEAHRKEREQRHQLKRDVSRLSAATSRLSAETSRLSAETDSLTALTALTVGPHLHSMCVAVFNRIFNFGKPEHLYSSRKFRDASWWRSQLMAQLAAVLNLEDSLFRYNGDKTIDGRHKSRAHL